MSFEQAGPLAQYYRAAQQETLANVPDLPLNALEEIIREQPTAAVGFTEAIVGHEGVAIIAEHKRKSPGAGEISPDSSVAWTVEQYRQGGAVAVSVLTQHAHFGGTLEDLREASNTVDMPLLRKDFIYCPYQLYEAKASGAAAALLIVAGLSPVTLRNLYKDAGDIGLDCLVEVHDREELQRALEIGPKLIGINNRNLKTLEVTLSTTADLIEAVPDDIIVVAESGYRTNRPDHVHHLTDLGADAVLIGESVMRGGNPAEELRTWQAS
jgi:indole-3-glycerol phosphate synthase